MIHLALKKESDLKKLLAYAGKYRYLTIGSWILSAISAWVALIPFYYIWKIIDGLLSVEPQFDQAIGLANYGWRAVGFALLSMLIYVVALMCSHIAAFHVQAQIRIKTMNHITTLPLGFLDHEGSGKIRKIVNESSEMTENYLAHQLPDKAVAIATPIGLLVLLLAFDWRLGLLSLLPVVLAFAIMSRMTGKKMKEKMAEYQNALENMSNEAVEYVRGIPVVKTFGQTIFSFKRFRQSIEQYQKWVIAYTEDFRGIMVLYTTCINAVFAVLIAATFVIGGSNDKSFLLNLLFYIIITPIITVTLNKILYTSENQLIVSDALSRIESITRRQPLEEATQPKNPKGTALVFKEVSFQYEKGEKLAVDHINMTIQEGEHVAFVGPSGGGKTTLANLITRFFDVTSGEIIVGGVNIKEIALEKLMDTISFVFQDSKLLKMSIYDNVRMGKPNASREEVMLALKNAQCQDIIDKMPQGIDTIIGSKGTYVSGGEAQRLSIARAMLKDAPILILDEATAFADPDNEVKVQAAFAQLAKDKTLIMIAHRLSTVTSVDRIYVLEEGQIKESGNHQSLLQNHGLYEHMWQAYQESAKWHMGNEVKA